MRFLRVVLCFVVAVGQLALAVPVVSADDVDEQGDTASYVIIAQMYPGTSRGDMKDHEFVELYNNTDTAVDVTNWCIEYRSASDNKQWSECLIAPDPSTKLMLAPYGYATFASETLKSEWPVVADVYFSGIINQARGYMLLLDASGAEVDRLGWGEVAEGYPAVPSSELVSGSVLQRKQIDNVMQDTDKDDEDFIVTAEIIIHASNIYEEEAAIVEPPLSVDTVSCDGVVINEIGANITEQFVELYNPTDELVPTLGCLLQTNRSTKTHTLTQEELGAGEYLVILIADTELTLTKTTSGTVELWSSDASTKADTVSYSNLKTETSWSRFMDGWRQTYAVTPGEENVDQPYLPCDDGYYRNMETGRCNKVVIEKPLAACAPDQYRNPETGRCKKTVVSTLTPCKEGQERNPETNRCRSVLGASTTRKPCKENQYRSEETNRCRNLPATSVPDAAFAVQPVEDTGATFVGWWVLGGLALLAVGYGVWEWRREVINILHKLLRRS